MQSKNAYRLWDKLENVKQMSVCALKNELWIRNIYIYIYLYIYICHTHTYAQTVCVNVFFKGHFIEARTGGSWLMHQGAVVFLAFLGYTCALLRSPHAMHTISLAQFT